MAEILDIYKTRIKEILKQNGKKSMSYHTLYGKCRGRKKDPTVFKKALGELVAQGIVHEKNDKYSLAKKTDTFHAVISRINKTFGFAEKEDGTEVFIPGKFLMGSMPGDVVLIKPLPSDGESPEGEVISVLEQNFSEFTGIIKLEGKTILITPDSIAKEDIIVTQCDFDVKNGDKALAVICRRGTRHSEHRARITAVFGSSEKASVSAEAVLYINGISKTFDEKVIAEAKAAEQLGIPSDEASKRLDLRDEIIFTIDGADTKDIDDAISVKKLAEGWELGVHIADVSFYVKPHSELDRSAFRRGTSIYYANKVIPMLPKELSNGICSLNPQEDRLAFSCIMNLDDMGQLIKYKFSKTIIRSRVKGVYSEVNRILECMENNLAIPQELSEKYAGLTDTIPLMAQLAAILTDNKLKRGAPQIETTESKLILDENDICIDVMPRERGKSELIIEEFMLMANTSAARLAKEKNIPFVYRIHEKPASEKIEELLDTAARLNITVPSFKEIKPKHLSMILEKTKDTPLSPIINKLVLRSMAKAKYSEEPLGHFGLVLSDYSHFTSPIRRYPDLAIHRILTDLCYEKQTVEYMQKRYTAFAHEASAHSSETELTAMKVEWECEDCYIAEYMGAHIGEEFEGMIVSVQDFGFFAALPNTVQGLVRIESLKNGPYDFDGHFTITKSGKPVYTIGDKVKVTCVSTDVSSGQVDFEICDE